jgi:SAM-dependent methyltransferase
MDIQMYLVDPESKTGLIYDSIKKVFLNQDGKSFPVVNHIPRFAESNNYALSFGLQWNKFSKTQLDSYTGTSISSDRLKRICGGDLNLFEGKRVLELGCGSGRFTEVLLKAGASVFAVDLSSAVDANYENCHEHPNHFVCQAHVYELPFKYEFFDLVVCIGVIQHTPNSEKTIETLCRYVKPSGMLLIDHYAHNYPTTFFRRRIRKSLLKKDAGSSYNYCEKLTKRLYPFHRFAWKLKKVPILNFLARAFIHFSPVVDYHDTYPQLSEKHLFEWMLLDTHDTLTDFYKQVRSAEEIERCLMENNMENIFTQYAGNGVESRSFKKSPSCAVSVA